MRKQNDGNTRYARYMRELDLIDKKRLRKLSQIMKLRDKLGIKTDG